MGTSVVPRNPTHRDSHDSFYEDNHWDCLLPPLGQMPTLLGNSIVSIPLGVCDIFLLTVLSRHDSSLNVEIYPFRVCRRENEEPRRLSEEIKRDVKLKLM